MTFLTTSEKRGEERRGDESLKAVVEEPFPSLLRPRFFSSFLLPCSPGGHCCINSRRQSSGLKIFFFPPPLNQFPFQELFERLRQLVLIFLYSITNWSKRCRKIDSRPAQPPTFLKDYSSS